MKYLQVLFDIFLDNYILGSSNMNNKVIAQAQEVDSFEISIHQLKKLDFIGAEASLAVVVESNFFGDFEHRAVGNILALEKLAKLVLPLLDRSVSDHAFNQYSHVKSVLEQEFKDEMDIPVIKEFYNSILIIMRLLNLIV